MSRRTESSRSPRFVLSRALLVAALGCVALACNRPQPLVESFEELSNAYLFTARGQSVAWTQPLNDPAWRRATGEDLSRPDDPTVGLYYGGEHWALPWWVLKNHHVANLTLGGDPIALTFCDRCSSASAFEPVAGGARLHFRLVGIRDGTILIDDEETGSLWSPFVGEAVEGPLAGHSLRRLPLVQCTMGEWLEMHPDSWVVEADPGARGGHAHDAFPGQEGYGDLLRRSLAEVDDRYPPHELVLGVRHGRSARGYPLAVLDELGPVTHDALGEREFVIFHKPESWLAIAYDRTLDGRALTFEPDADGRIVDRETGSVWSYEGIAESGPLRGERLEFMTSGIEEWYIWAIQHPQTELAESLS